MPTTTFAPRVARHARLVKEQLRSARSRTTRPQTDPYVRHLAKEILSRETEPRRRGVEQTCALVGDLAGRGELEDAEAVGYLLIAVAQQEYRATHPETLAPLDVATAHIAEQRAEGIVNDAETEMSHHPTVANYLRYLTARAGHVRAVERLDESVRAELVRENAVT